MSDGEPLVRFRGVRHAYGEAPTLDGLDLEIRRGETFGLIGPDGAGKTTALRLALGLLKPRAGEVRTCGLDPAARRRQLASRVGYLSQRFSLYGDLSVDENMAFFARVHGVRDWRPRARELLELMRLDGFGHRLAERLSGGMKQKLALACTLIHTPELLVLDEPTTGVDPVSRRDLWLLLARLAREGLTLLLTTPYLDEAERCGRVGLLHRGRLLAMDAPKALRQRFPAAIVELMARPRRRAVEVLRGHPAVDAVETFGERLHVAVRPPPGTGAAEVAAELAAALRAARLEPEAVRTVEPSLEDVFIELIRDVDAESSRPEAQE